MTSFGNLLLGVFVLFTASAIAADDGPKTCLSKGGNWQQVCLSQRFTCVMPYADAGKSCTDSSQCKGLCMVDMTIRCDVDKNCPELKVPKPGEAASGICQRDDDPCGSFVVIKKGRAQEPFHRD